MPDLGDGLRTTTVVTYEAQQSDGLIHRICVCAECEEQYRRLGTRPKTSRGTEYCQIYRGAGPGLCEAPIHADLATAYPA